MSSQDNFRFLVERQSASILIEPGPSHQDLQKILATAGTVPDHGGLKPYRFIVIQGAARDSFGESLINAAEEAKGTRLDESVRVKIKAKAFAAPLQILIIFSPVEQPKIPDWEQMAAASCTGYAMDLAANALGFGSVWKNFAYGPGRMMKQLFQLQPSESVLGWINIGTEQARDRPPRAAFDIARHVIFLS
ncbi:MAG: nitroreductase [Proteobacteria bacterium]|nr:nitroreductase [Pseudomonadota bacterium]